MNKAYSLLDIKSVSQSGDVITVRGIASTPTTDRVGDIVEPMGARFKTPMPMFLFHDSQRPVGRVMNAKASSKGIEFWAELPKIKEPGLLQDRVNEAIHSLQYGLIGATSIGFKGTPERLKTGGDHFKEWDWLELSLVTIPANPDAVITGVKSIDSALRAAPGRTQSGSPPPGASGTKQPASGGFFYSRSPKGNAMKTLKELREEREVKAARYNEIADNIKAKTASDEEATEFDDLELEIKDLDMDIRVKRADDLNASTAKRVDGSSSEAAARSRASRDTPVTKNADPEDKFPGQSFAKVVKAKAVAFIVGEPVGIVAQKMFGRTNPKLVEHIKAAVAGGGTGSGEWGAELVGIDNRYTGDFVTYLHGRTGFDQLGLREAPLNVAVKGMDGAAVGYWVGESKAIPASAPSASTTDLTGHKLGGKCVMSNELMMDSSPGAEMMVRDALAEALALRLDQTFFSAVAASAGVSPAGILNGLTQIAIASQDAAGLRAFINAAASGFISAKTASGLVLVMSPGTALAVGMLVNALGQSEFPSLTEIGGNLLGRRVVVSDNIDPSQIILVNPREIWRIGDGGVEFAISREAMVEQNDAPQGASDTPVASSATLVSMFDTDSVAIRATRRVSWKLRRAAAAVVAFTDTADFGGVSS